MLRCCASLRCAKQTAPGGTFGEESEGFVRISLAAAEEDIAEGLERFCQYVLEREREREREQRQRVSE